MTQKFTGAFEEKLCGLTVTFNDRADFDRLKTVCADVRSMMSRRATQNVSDTLNAAEDTFSRLGFRDTHGRDTRAFTITRNDDGTGGELVRYVATRAVPKLGIAK